MINIQKSLLLKYSLNAANSVQGEAQSYDYPGHDSETAIDISEISIEEKTILLKLLNIGASINFKIDQEITIPVPNVKTQEYDDFKFYARGEGSGEILEISEFDLNFDDDEYQEITIKLTKGYAENL